jgi:TPR repeat protein
MKIFIYLFISILSLTGVANAETSKSQDDVLLRYEKLKVLAVKGDLDSQYEIWNFAKNNRPKLDNHLREAFSFITKAGQAGHVEAQFTIGSMYQTGTIREKNSDVALSWLLGAANNGHKNAQLLTANNYANRAVDADNDEIKNKNEKLAVYWYEQSIKGNNVLAIKAYGVFLFVLDHFSEKAKTLLEQAAGNNDSGAMHMLGRMYSHRWSDNRGDTEFELAHSWFEKAKQNGYKSQSFIDELDEKKKNYLERITKENKEEK